MNNYQQETNQKQRKNQKLELLSDEQLKDVVGGILIGLLLPAVQKVR